jgi:hypothetical protein
MTVDAASLATPGGISDPGLIKYGFSLPMTHLLLPLGFVIGH